MSDIRSAYDAAAPAWRDGPARAYARMAAALLDHAPVPLAGARVLDVGAGSCVAALEARRRGAALVAATDLAAGMLVPGLPAAVADARALPFGDGAFDLVVQGFVLNHLADPVPALAEARRVAGAVAASTFDPGWEHPAKAVVDAVLAEAGFVVPDWYVAMQNRSPRGASSWRAAALGTGYRSVDVVPVEVATGLDTPQDLVDWRWGMAHVAPFLATLSPARRAEHRARAEEAVTGLPPVVVAMLVLSAR
ncbi:MAG: class I SAM-dependent methyltransferase [Nocardioidaceae bacterium]|nr:class I SAM-dependent methyltransferase [Nocardioidaceae bacterium]